MLTLPNLWAGLCDAVKDAIIPSRRRARAYRLSEIARYANILTLRHMSTVEYYVWIGKGFEPWQAFDQLTGDYGARVHPG